MGIEGFGIKKSEIQEDARNSRRRGIQDDGDF